MKYLGYRKEFRMLNTKEIEEQNKLLKEQLQILKELNTLIEKNQHLKLPNRITQDTWSLLTTGCGGCTPLS